MQAHVIGIKPWKRWQIDPFLRPDYSKVSYARSAESALQQQAREGGELVVWAAREPEDFAARAQQQGAAIVRIEDGFIRSAGLGSNHVGGYSIVLDRSGIYFDPRRPSALERLLQEGEFEEAMIARAAHLRQRLIESGLTKYNVGGRDAPRISGAGKLRVLVPGQVEDDASVRHGGGALRSNLALLEAVRAELPQAWIVYKPHPDTEAGTRIGHVDETRLLKVANQVVRGISSTALFPQVDCVHTLTSLLGFEALLRGLPVTTWGQPFYAGWGLTQDRAPMTRRTRKRSLDELVAATLIRYPRYRDPAGGERCEVERVIEALLAGNVNAQADTSRVRRYARLMQGWLRGLRLQ